MPTLECILNRGLAASGDSNGWCPDRRRHLGGFWLPRLFWFSFTPVNPYNLAPARGSREGMVERVDGLR